MLFEQLVHTYQRIIEVLQKQQLTDVQFIQFAPASSTRGHCYKLFDEQTSSNCRYQFFASPVVPVWNSLPSNIVNFSTLPKFKTSLFLVDLSKFLKYQLD